MTKFMKFFRGDNISDERYAELMLMGQNSHYNFLRSLSERISKLERQYRERDIREIEELTDD